MPPLSSRTAPKLSEGDIRRDIEIALNRQGIVRVFLNAQYSGPARGGYTRPHWVRARFGPVLRARSQDGLWTRIHRARGMDCPDEPRGRLCRYRENTR
jgi:hypothetical protein